MKINSLTISNFRGINGEFELEPKTENVVIVGPNGSGKSSVIAAIDFLLTGSIRELSGEGSQSLTETRHGPHIDSDPTDAWVEGEFMLNGDSLTVRRSVSDRTNPSIGRDDDDEEEFGEDFESVTRAAERGLHLLSRDEILDFITAQAGSRSESIRSLLDLQNVQSRRLALDNAAGYFENEANRLEREADRLREDLYTALESESDSDDSVLQLVNDLREDLGGNELTNLDEQFDSDIDSPSRRVIASPLLRSDGRQRIEELQEWFDTDVEDFLEADEAYREQWNEIDIEGEARRDLKRQRLVELGKEAIDDDAERCPLCLNEWDPEELRENLSERLEEAEELQKKLDELEERRDAAQQSLTDVRVVAESLHETLTGVDEFDGEPLEEFVELVQDWEDAYNQDLLSKPPKDEMTKDDRDALLRPDDLQSMLEELDQHISSGPELDELESAWSNLQAANQRYDEMHSNSRNAAEYRRVAQDVRTTHQKFVEARDSVLNRIYDEIEDKFERYYTTIHTDETDFGAGLDPTETGLEMEVEFYDRGQHPPHALHSEGHQDSMGICLYFALYDWLQEQEEISIMMLDDVVMSIDSEHRRPLARLMASEIAEDHQLFITTHDDLWHRHLRSSGVVNSNGVVQFSDWNIEDGPKIIDRPEMEWETIEEELNDGNVSIAAHQTRRMAEWFLREACDRLDGKVPFKANSQWNLGDFQQGVISRYKSLVKSAKASADSWNRDMRVSHFEELDNKMTEISERISHDGAALNPNVHWNETESEFANCTPGELRPAINVYRELYEMLWCNECDSCLRVVKDGHTDDSVKCNCSSVNWNLRMND
ncbi:hypothetical protein BV210_05025 [Halorientalis sp. IM1011]|uniref:AAA family ATPase n=1 Tax=Halorientalis sp. IM1011 TaxID=1932360 RepID=UPI00097CD37C|nr:AAA family ATPase [Halorientalis sp. IM1011]AQL42113.1 hypothetical protein BV210_05025 [Halorientalis sp. IM1011]